MVLWIWRMVIVKLYGYFFLFSFLYLYFIIIFGNLFEVFWVSFWQLFLIYFEFGCCFDGYGNECSYKQCRVCVSDGKGEVIYLSGVKGRRWFVFYFFGY